MQAVILAGGLGTRLRPYTETIPKPMVPVQGKPFLEYELLLLKSHGISDFVLCVGHLGEQIVDYFGDGKKHDVRIQYSYDGQNLLGPAGALKRAFSILNDSFFVTYGDAYLRLDYQKVMADFMNSDKLALMVVYENRNKYGRSDVIVKDGYVVSYNKSDLGKNEGMASINFGVSALRKHALEAIPENKPCGEEEFYGKLIQQRQLLAHPTMERFYEIGNSNSLREFEEFISTEKSLPS
ncbi:MAG: sugar phosphate nucleotidyltransferase [Nitrososphaerales archaeon]